VILGCESERFDRQYLTLFNNQLMTLPNPLTGNSLVYKNVWLYWVL